MKIGNGWTKNTEKGETYISIALDEIIGVLFPSLRPLLEDCFLTLWHIPQTERKDEKSPQWTFNITRKKEKDEKKNEDVSSL